MAFLDLDRNGGSFAVITCEKSFLICSVIGHVKYSVVKMFIYTDHAFLKCDLLSIVGCRFVGFAMLKHLASLNKLVVVVTSIFVFISQQQIFFFFQLN